LGGVDKQGIVIYTNGAKNDIGIFAGGLTGGGAVKVPNGDVMEGYGSGFIPRIKTLQRVPQQRRVFRGIRRQIDKSGSQRVGVGI
jgi:hypothetical protein